MLIRIITHRLMLIAALSATVAQLHSCAAPPSVDRGGDVATPQAAKEPGDHAQWGRTPARNNVVSDPALTKTIPLTWDIGEFEDDGKWKATSGTNIKWVARLGSNAFGNPVVAEGKVYVGTNNDRGYLARYPAGKVDLGVLLSFDERDGKFLWQYSSEKLKTGDRHDYSGAGICSSPLVRDGRVYFVTNRCEVVCLDAEGFQDGENGGPVKDEANENRDEADVIWRYDMIKELGVEPLFMTASSVTEYGGFLFVQTCNSAAEDMKTVPAPKAANFIALKIDTGKLAWSDNTGGANLLHGTWTSPALDERNQQVIFAGGDAWIYGFSLPRLLMGDERIERLWRFDCNRKTSQWGERGKGDRTNLTATPVVHDGAIYIATGQTTEQPQTPGILWCIKSVPLNETAFPQDLDRSAERVFNPKHAEGNEPLPAKRDRCADPDAGDIVKPNPKSAAVWSYSGADLNNDGKLAFEETFHRSISNVAVKDGLLFAVDFVGVVHCLDARTGKPHWTHDMLGGSWSSPLIVRDRVYICMDDGHVLVFALSKEKKLLAENDMGEALYSTPIVANGVLYISTKTRLFAIKGK